MAASYKLSNQYETRTAAKQALFNMLESGEVSEWEHPRIVKEKVRIVNKTRKVFLIELAETLAIA